MPNNGYITLASEGIIITMIHIYLILRRVRSYIQLVQSYLGVSMKKHLYKLLANKAQPRLLNSRNTLLHLKSVI